LEPKPAAAEGIDTRRHTLMLWGNVINALVGVWFIIAPFVLGLQANPGATWTSIIGGLILLVLAGWAVLNEEARKRRWIQYVNGSVGV
jgi:VIT1/CCC1 family predicted Fe2+/Mn2+ transporter